MVEECYDCSDDDAVAVIGRNTIRDEKDGMVAIVSATTSPCPETSPMVKAATSSEMVTTSHQSPPI